MLVKKQKERERWRQKREDDKMAVETGVGNEIDIVEGLEQLIGEDSSGKGQNEKVKISNEIQGSLGQRNSYSQNQEGQDICMENLQV